ncbi:MAG TPA: hypothetical protein ENJ50_08700, partial [Planctomycetaceae bacterium]|nr:hypothetical protein [Planctomycetaceae bacterium]
MTTSLILVLVAAFVGVAALVGGVAMLFQQDEASATEERLEVLTGTRKRGKGGSESELLLLSSPLDETRGLLDRLVEPWGGFQRFLKQADSPLTVGQLGAASLLLAGIGFVINLA